LRSWVTTQNRLTTQTDGQAIITKVLSHIFSTMFAKWMNRNDDIHGNCTLITDRHFQAFSAPRVRHLLDQKHLISAHYRQTLDFETKESHKTIENWLATNERYLLEAIKREHSRQTSKLHKTTRFFPVLHHPPTSSQRPPPNSHNHQICTSIQPCLPESSTTKQKHVPQVKGSNNNLCPP
jgi:hypothetical protein